MAIDADIIHSDVHGSSRVIMYSCTADGADQELATGMDFIYNVAFAPKSMASSPWSLERNQLSSGTASVGNLSITGVASGDEFYVTVWGR